MLTDLIRRLRPDPVRSRIRESIRAGTGLSKADWVLDGPTIEPAAVDQLIEDITTWCRERIATIRRPYGIDQLALAVACAPPGGDPLASRTFGVFRPVDFYAEDGIPDRIGEFVRAIPPDRLNAEIAAGASGIRFAAALFSWGDIAREAIFGDERA